VDNEHLQSIMKKDLLAYLKSFRKGRWIAPAIMIIVFELLLIMFSPIYSLYGPMWLWYTSAFFFWIVLDYTIGIGRTEPNVWKNVAGVLFIIGAIVLYVSKTLLQIPH